MLKSRMVVENVIQIGNPILREKSKKVIDVNLEETKRVIINLTDSMRHHDLVGMAAGQIGEKIRIFVTEIRKTPTRDEKTVDKLRIFINPKIIWFSKKKTIIYEGCGSVANGNLFGPVRRSEKIKIRALGKDGKKFELKADGLLARVIQHEYDHLSGIEFIEKITDMKKVMSRSEYLCYNHS
jgi:peptide deformylase